MSYADRVRAGVALLDTKMPGWHKQIDLGRLSLGSGGQCILGQLFGGLFIGLKRLDVDCMEVDFGFDPDCADAKRGYRTLNRLWSYVIRKRQAESAEIDREVREDRTRDAGGFE